MGVPATIHSKRLSMWSLSGRPEIKKAAALLPQTQNFPAEDYHNE
jgi:hypothetical protein